jgi:hypothetical protein
VSGERGSEGESELRLAPESVEAIARRLVELLGPDESRPPKRLLSAAEVSEWWGVDRDWVYVHADQLGARRLGAGKRPRLRFDPDEVAERIAAAGAPATADRRRSAPLPGDSGDGSLSHRSRAIFARQSGMAGARRKRPRPGAEGGASTR